MNHASSTSVTLSMSRFVYYNDNPYHKDTQDCTVRAISLFLNKSWDDVYWGICDAGYHLKQMPSTNSTWSAYLRSERCKRYNTLYCYTVEEFCQIHPYGEFLLKVDGHVVTVLNGYYYDTWDSGDQIVDYYWVKGE